MFSLCCILRYFSRGEGLSLLLLPSRVRTYLYTIKINEIVVAPSYRMDINLEFETSSYPSSYPSIAARRAQQRLELLEERRVDEDLDKDQEDDAADRDAEDELL